MVKQILKIIWREKRINSWITAELILIFTILWFCCDYLYLMTSKYLEPIGFDITNTYNLTLGTLPPNITGEVSVADKEDAFNKIFMRLKANPSIESVCISAYATPYTGAWRAVGYQVDSMRIDGLWTKSVSPEFFDVFKIRFEKGRTFDTNEILNGKYIILGGDGKEQIKDIPIARIDSIKENTTQYKVIGAVNRVKRVEYEDYSAVAYLPISSDLKFVNNWNTTISFRVKPEADVEGFDEKFVKEMRSQLNISPYFFIGIESLDLARTSQMKWGGYDNGLKSTFSITAFLVINIFLGIIGTFWLRTQSRRSEIGLQMALGASRARIRNTYILESLIILFISSLIGTLLAVNIMATGAFDNLGLPMVQVIQLKDISTSQFIIDYLLTFGVLTIITVFAVWYPSQRASGTKPAIVLRSE